MMNPLNVQVGTQVRYRSQHNSDLQLSVIVRHVDPNYVIVEHEDGTSSCVCPESIIPQPCLTSSEVIALYDAHQAAVFETRAYIMALPKLGLADAELEQMKAFAKKALRLTNNDFNLLERIVKFSKDVIWSDLLDDAVNEVTRQRELLSRGVDVWNRLHPDMPIAR